MIYIKEAQVEIKKVTWPTRQQSLQYTAIVAIISVAATIILGGLDLLFNYILTQFIL
ncbi:preprotein translocase subunit SecE [bacterium]|nr:preprotein translocase subunit SecE [Candidatus Elulimicrobium humile]